MPEEIRREETPGPRASIYEERRLEGRGIEYRGEGRGFLSWGGVWAGVMGAIGMEILFILFGLFIYFVMFNPAAPGTGGARVWGAIWFLVTSFFALYFGGWVASKCAGSTTKRNGTLHGWVTWGLATLGSLLLVIMAATPILTSLASLAGGAAAAAPQVAAQTGTPPGAVMGNVNPTAIGLTITGNLKMLFLFWFIGTGLGFLGGWAGGAAGAAGGPTGRGAEAAPPSGRLAA